MDSFSLLFFFVTASTLQALLQARCEAMQRARQIAVTEKERYSRVITMICRRETRSSQK